MQKLHFEYDMRISFTPPVERHRFSLKCVPLSSGRQQITNLETEVFPQEFLSVSRDSFGNHCIYGYAKNPHDHFSVRVSGDACTGLIPLEKAGAAHLAAPCKYQTSYTMPGPAIRAFAAWAQSQAQFFNLCTGQSQAQFSEFCAGQSQTQRMESGRPVQSQAGTAETPEPSGAGAGRNRQIAEGYMRALHERFVYRQGVTGIHTTAEEAMAQGEGVCQDYAHILLSLCRMHQIPCRYVVGMMTGEGQSHAWVEIWDSGYWVELDPTNNLIVNDQHIRISCGRDYRDCVMNQGVFCGKTVQTQEVLVRVAPEE